MRRLVAITAFASGVLLVIVPRFILPACEYEGYSRMHCSDTANAEYVVGALLMAVGGGAYFIRSAWTTAAGAAASILLYGVSFRLPDIYGYCRSSRMPCNYGMVPGIRFIGITGALIMIIALIGSIRAIRRKGR